MDINMFLNMPASTLLALLQLSLINELVGSLDSCLQGFLDGVECTLQDVKHLVVCKMIRLPRISFKTCSDDLRNERLEILPICSNEWHYRDVGA